MRSWLFLIGFGALWSVARAELPVEVPITDLPSNGAPGGIVVPDPIRGGSSGTNEIKTGTEPTPAPDLRQYYPGTENWRLVPPARLSNDVLTLRNQDLLPGRFAGWDGPTIRWDCAGARAPIRFRTEGVGLLRLAPEPAAPPPPAPRWVVRLTSGNVVGAEELTVDGQTVALRTRAAGALKIPREMVAAFYHDPEPGAGKFRALQHLDEWERINAAVRGGQGWVNPFGDEMVIYRELQLPEAALIEFDLPNRDNLNLQIHLGVSSFRGLWAESHVRAVIGGNQLYLQVFGPMGFQENEPVALPRGRSGAVRVGLAINHVEGTVAVYFDGQQVRRRFLPNVAKATVRNLILVGGGTGDGRPGRLPFRTLVLSRVGGDLNLLAPKPEEDTLRLANSDSLIGQLLALGTNSVTFVGNLGRIELPLERVTGGSFAASKRAEPRRRNGDVGIQLADGGDLTAELKELGPQGLVLESDLFGRVTLARAAVQGVQFGLYAPAAKPPVPVHPAMREVAPGTVQLQSGEYLGGTLAGLSNGIVHWQFPAALDAIELAQTNVVFVNPAPAGGSLTNLPALPGRVQLTNGDVLRAEVLSVDGRQVQVRTLYAGALAVARAYVAGLRPGAVPEGVLDAGPLERWNSDKRSPNVFQREFNLPPRFSLSFEAAGPPTSWNLALLLCRKEVRQKNWNGQTGYHVNLQRESVMLQTLALNPAGDLFRSNPAQAAMPGFNRRDSVQVTCLVDRPKNEIYLMVDGKLATKDIGQRQQTGPDGNGILFIFHAQPPLQIRDLVLAEWKGTAEALSAALPAGDQVRLHDQTLLAGAIETLRDGVVVRTGQAPVALGRVGTIHFDPANAVRARRTRNDVRVTLVNGDQLTLTAPRLDERGVTGTVEGIGPVSLAAEAVRRLDFQP